MECEQSREEWEGRGRPDVGRYQTSEDRWRDKRREELVGEVSARAGGNDVAPAVVIEEEVVSISSRDSRRAMGAAAADNEGNSSEECADRCCCPRSPALVKLAGRSSE